MKTKREKENQKKKILVLILTNKVVSNFYNLECKESARLLKKYIIIKNFVDRLSKIVRNYSPAWQTYT